MKPALYPSVRDIRLFIIGHLTLLGIALLGSL